jgi:hypothetical protein
MYHYARQAAACKFIIMRSPQLVLSRARYCNHLLKSVLGGAPIGAYFGSD